MKCDFESIRRRARTALLAEVPALTDRAGHPLVAMLVDVMALNMAQLLYDLPDDSVTATFHSHPNVDDGPAAVILADAARSMRSRIDGSKDETPSIADAINRAGLIDMAAIMLLDGVPLGEVQTLHDVSSTAARKLIGNLDRLKNETVAAVLIRDLPAATGISQINVNQLIRWLLAIEHEGKTMRRTALERRWQAHAAYGALQTVLQRPHVTHVIDAGEELAPVLQRDLRINAAQLRTLNGLVGFKASLSTFNSEKSAIVADLLAFDVPTHDWPRALASLHWTGRTNALLSPDYMSGSATPVRNGVQFGAPSAANDTAIYDTLRAFMTDIFAPIARTRATDLRISHGAARTMNELFGGNDLKDKIAPDARRAYLAGVHRAIVGPRKPKAFKEAVMVWHRRAACAAALRHENRSGEDNGWPALCAPWSTDDGSITVTPITSGAGLVEEGNVMNHCVGGYYDQCRSGRTHILSMKGPDSLAATLEMLVAIKDGRFVMTRGQFKTYNDARPGDELQDAVRRFLSDLASGAHKVAKGAILEHIRKERENGDYRSGDLDMDHARKIWPLYRVMMPRPAPETLDEWMAASGIVETIDAAIRAMPGVTQCAAMEKAA